jgi:hypothetical protein
MRRSCPAAISGTGAPLPVDRLRNTCAALGLEEPAGRGTIMPPRRRIRGTPAPLRPRNRCAASTLYSSCAGLTRASTARRVQADSRGSLDQARGRRKGDKCAAPVGRGGGTSMSPPGQRKRHAAEQICRAGAGSAKRARRFPPGNRCAALGQRRGAPRNRCAAPRHRARGTPAPRSEPAEQTCRGTNLPRASGLAWPWPPALGC